MFNISFKHVNVIFGLNCILFNVACFIVSILNINFFFYDLFNYFFKYLFGDINFYIFISTFFIIGFFLIIFRNKLIKKIFILNLFNFIFLFIFGLFLFAFFFSDYKENNLFGLIGIKLINIFMKLNNTIRFLIFIFFVIIYIVFIIFTIFIVKYKIRNKVKKDIDFGNDDKKTEQVETFKDEIIEKVDFWKAINS